MKKKRKWIAKVAILATAVLWIFALSACERTKTLTEEELSALMKETTPTYDYTIGGESYTFYFDRFKLDKRKTKKKESDTVWATVTYTTEDKEYSIQEEGILYLSFYTEGGWQIDSTDDGEITVLVNDTMSDEEVAAFFPEDEIKVVSNELEDKTEDIIDHVVIQHNDKKTLHEISGQEEVIFHFSVESGWYMTERQPGADFQENWLITDKTWVSTQDADARVLLNLTSFSLAPNREGKYSASITGSVSWNFEEYDIDINTSEAIYENGRYRINIYNHNEANAFFMYLSPDAISVEHENREVVLPKTDDSEPETDEQTGEVSATEDWEGFNDWNNMDYTNGTTQFSFVEINGDLLMHIWWNNGYNGVTSCPLTVVDDDTLHFKDDTYDLYMKKIDDNTIEVSGNNPDGYTPGGYYTKGMLMEGE